MGGKFLASPGENKTDQCLFCKCFIKWDDVAAPIIRFSDDESLAVAIVQKQATLTRPDSLGKLLTDTNDYVWFQFIGKKKRVGK